MDRNEQRYEIEPAGEIVLRLGDITTATTDVIVSSDDTELSMTQGVSDAIQQAADDEQGTYTAEVQSKTDKTEVGKAVVTGAGKLPAEHIYHAITVPTYENPFVEDPIEVVRSCTKHCLELARAMSMSSIAFPALGMGRGAFDPEDVAVTMAEVIKRDLTGASQPLRVEIFLLVEDVDSPMKAVKFFSSFTQKAEMVDQAVRSHTVLMIHGIRTQAEWQGVVREALKRGDPDLNPIPVGYGYFDALRFLIPIPWVRGRAARAVRARIDALGDHDGPLSIIAHSFGTYLVGTLLREKPDLHVHRLILCGGILPINFPWERLKKSIAEIGDPDNPTFHVLNDCGWKDYWPVMAESITWGYGSSGRFGYKHPLVHDRFHEMGHSGFFKEDFVKQFWLPALAADTISPGPSGQPKSPWWLSMLTVVKLKYLAMVLIVIAVWVVVS